MDTFEGFSEPTQNWSKLPHDLINALPIFSSKAEIAVVLYILRHTWGFSEFDRPKRITLDEFEYGRKLKGGGRIDNGVGMTRPAIVDGLKKAAEHGFIRIEIDESDKARVKKFYTIKMTKQDDVKDFYPDVKQSNIDGKESTPRSEKETLSKTKDSADATATAPRFAVGDWVALVHNIHDDYGDDPVYLKGHVFEIVDYRQAAPGHWVYRVQDGDIDPGEMFDADLTPADPPTPPDDDDDPPDEPAAQQVPDDGSVEDAQGDTPDWNECRDAFKDAWNLGTGRANILNTLNFNRSKKHPDCGLDKPLTPEQIRNFPAWYYTSKRGGGAGMKRSGVSLPLSPPVFQQYAEQYQQYCDRPAAIDKPCSGDIDSGAVFDLNRPLRDIDGTWLGTPDEIAAQEAA